MKAERGLTKVEFAAAVAVASLLAAAFLWHAAALTGEAKRARASAMRSEIVEAAAAAKSQCLASAATGTGACPQSSFDMEAGGSEGPVKMAGQYPKASMDGIVRMAKILGASVDGASADKGEALFPVGGDAACLVRYKGPVQAGSQPSVDVDDAGC